MPALTFQCPKCAGEIESETESMGQLTACPNCMEQVLVTNLPPGFAKLQPRKYGRDFGAEEKEKPKFKMPWLALVRLVLGVFCGLVVAARLFWILAKLLGF